MAGRARGAQGAGNERTAQEIALGEDDVEKARHAARRRRLVGEAVPAVGVERIPVRHVGVVDIHLDSVSPARRNFRSQCASERGSAGTGGGHWNAVREPVQADSPQLATESKRTDSPPKRTACAPQQPLQACCGLNTRRRHAFYVSQAKRSHARRAQARRRRRLSRHAAASTDPSSQKKQPAAAPARRRQG